MKMRWRFATIFAAICAVSPVGAVQGVKDLTPEEVARMNAQLNQPNQPNSQREPANNAAGGRLGTQAPTAATTAEQERINLERLSRLGAGPLALLKLTAVNAAQGANNRVPIGVKPKDPPPGARSPMDKTHTKAGKQSKRQKPSKKQAKSR
ncbi:MAG: hypothetical protein RLZZ495_823 [Pseudomonadota bacterium]|jgi:hypothetical protein